MRTLAWLSCSCLVVTACALNPVASPDGGTSADGGAHRGISTAGSAGATGAGTAGASGAAGNTGPTGAAGGGDTTGAAGATGMAGTTGAAGDMATGGSTGTAGAAGATGMAGATGAAGNTGAAGMTGTAGNTGAAGMTGTAGNTGAAGMTGAAGATGSAGSGGSGAAGATGDGGDVCTTLEEQYAAALTTAKKCDPQGHNQCQQNVPTSIACPNGCSTMVNDTTPLDDISQKWQDAGCDKIKRICPAVLCVAPGKVMCVAGQGIDVGMCTSGLLTPGPVAQ
jgi:hypothetical protein